MAEHSWLSAGLVWMQGASGSGIKGVFDDSGPDGLESRPTINLFELWQYGVHLPKLVIARNYSFPKPLVVPWNWVFAPTALSLSDAVNSVSQHEEGRTWSQASHISMVAGINYPNQPERNPGSILSDPLTYWWGVTLCPPERNDASLAESVVIHMGYAAIREMYLNTEVQKPSLEEILDFHGPRMDFTEESTPHPEARAYLSAHEGGEVLQDFEIEDEGDEKKSIERKTRDMVFPLRSEGQYSAPTNPWPGSHTEEEAHLQETGRRQPLGPVW